MAAVATEEPSSPKLERPPGNEVIKNQTNRHSTDILFAILIFLSWIALSAIGAYVYLKGDYRVVYYPMDYAGNICGTNVATNTLNVSEYSRIVYVNSFGGGVCVKKCPNVTELVDVRTFVTYTGVYQGNNASLPANYIDMPDYATAYMNNTDSSNFTCNSFKCPTDPNYSWISLGVRMGTGYAYYAMDTVEIFGRRCLVNPNAKKVLEEQVNIPTGNVVNTKFVNNQYEFWKNLYSDLYTAKEYIFGFGFLVSLVIGLLYSSLLRIKWLVHTMVWLSILCTISAIFALGTYLFYISKHWASQDPPVYSDNFIQGAKICAYVLFAIGALLVFLIIYLRKEIHLAMALIQTAAASVGSMPIIVFFPIFQSLCLIAFVVTWIFYAVNLASLGKIVPKQLPVGASVSVRTFEFDDLTWQLAWYILFCLFWTTTFIGSTGQLIVAMCAAKWYFTRDKSKIHSGAVFSNMRTVLRYHMGTAAFGSLIIAIILLLRAIVMYFQRKAKQLNSRIAGILLCCCQCCLWCIQKFMEFVSKNAYIYCAMFGTPFCKSAREAFSLILRNAARVGTLSYVSVMVVFVGRLFISTTTAAASWVIMQHFIGSKLYSLAGPTVIIFLIAYHVGDMFMQVFNMTASTILHCFVADEEMFDSAEQYATEELREFIDKNESKARKVLKVEG